MKFSTKGEYALRAIVNLARCYPQRKNLKIIATEEHISLKYLERLMRDLKRNKLVKSFRGKEGGYVLAVNPSQIKVGQVIEATEGPITIKCYGAKCKLVHKCPSSFVWIKLGKQIKKTLDAIKIADLIK